MDEDARELALVEKAIRSGLSNCFDWANDKVLARVRSEPSLQGLTPEYIKRRLHDFVAEEGVGSTRGEKSATPGGTSASFGIGP